MGIRSLLRNAFGRSKAARNESRDARKNTDKPEAVTIPEAREESIPAPVAPPTAPPEAEVPAARTAPAEPVPTSTPKTASLPAQSSPVDRAPKPTAKAPTPAAAPAPTPAADEAPVRDEPTAAPEAPKPAADPTDAAAPKEEAAAKGLDAPRPSAAADAPAVPVAPDSAPDSAADLVSQAFDNPVPAAATTAEDDPAPKPAAQPEREEAQEEKETVAAAVTPEKVVDEAPAAAVTEAPAPEAAPDVQAAEPAAQEPANEAPAPTNQVAATAPALLPLHEAARATLEKHGLAAQRATVYLVLDRSGSMRNYYKDGTVQHLAEQALGLSAHLDEKATVPVVFFSTDVDGTADLDLASYEGRIEELHSGLGHMGRTNYHWAIEAVVTHYTKSGSTDPAFVIFQTDGAPTSKPAAERALCQAAQLPIFWQFIGFGDPDAKGFDFLRKLDDLAIPEKRVVDNAGFFHAGRAPRSLSHEELYQQLMVEFPEWLTEARAAKVLKDS
ncbi:VWA domain-containing protein [Streptomyces sp. NPDC090442]|uniref:vWA domain-containing protein n=1 Tax=Streptomyces sp. NPDC090442 TaxID=3365962 RepID=UPI003813A129